MATRGGQLGNQNAARGGQIRAAMERALDMRSKVAGIKALDAICQQLVADALEAQTARERLAAAAEIFDRVDGKAAQVVAGDAEAPLEILIRNISAD